MVLFGAVIGWLQAIAWNGRQHGGDWASLWIAGELARDGKPEHFYDRDPADFSGLSGDVWFTYAEPLSALRSHPFVHNPVVAGAMRWVTEWTDFDTSLLWLTGLSGLALVVLIASAYYAWTNDTIPTTWLWATTAACWVLPAYHSSLWLGQTSVLIFAGVMYAIAASRPRPVIAGLVLACVAIVKLTPVVLIPLMLVYPTRRLAGAVAAGATAALAATSYFLYTPDVFRTWWENIQQINGGLILSEVNQSLPSMLLQGQRDDTVEVHMLTEVPEHATLWTYGLALVLGALLLWVAWLFKDDAFAILAVGGFTVATVCGSLVWNHYYLFVIGTVFGLLTLTSRWNIMVPLIAISAVWFYQPLSFVVGGRSPLYIPFNYLIGTWILFGCLLVLACITTFELRRERRIKTVRKQ